MKSLLAYLRQLRGRVIGLNVIQARFDILQTYLDAITASLAEVTVSVKNLERIAKSQPSAGRLEKSVGQLNNANSQDELLRPSTGTADSTNTIANSLNQIYSELDTSNTLLTNTHEIETVTPNDQTANLVDPEDISIIIPVYNHEDTLAEALESVLMQEMPYTSVIYCLNDASTDKSADILNDYSIRYPGRIKIYTNPKNLGSGKRSIYYQQPPVLGRYWCILEGDDYWSVKDKLAKQISFLDANPEFIGCSGHTVMKNEMTGEESIIKPDRNAWNLLDLILLQQKYAFYVHTSSIIWRHIYMDRGFFLPPSFKEESAIGDVLLMHMMLSTGGNMQNIPEVMSCYRVTGRGIWTSKSAQEQAELNDRLLKNISQFVPLKYRVFILFQELRHRSNIIKSLVPGPVNE